MSTMEGDLEDGVVKEAAPAHKKKLLFSTPTFAKPPEQKEGIDFFSRGEELFKARLAEEERRRQRKLEKQERKRLTISAERKLPDTPDTKRRRVSQTDDEVRSTDSSPNQAEQDQPSWVRRESTLSTPGSRKSRSSSQQKSHESPISLAGRYSRDLQVKTQEASISAVAAKGYISLSDSENETRKNPKRPSKAAAQPISLYEDDNDVIPLSAAQSTSQPELIEDDEISDDEFAELAREAREKAKKKEAEHFGAEMSFDNQNHISDRATTPDDPVDDVFGERAAIPVDPVVEIFVSSRIDGTNPLKVRRKFTQRLKEVRLSWCDKQVISGQPFTQAMKNSIFLTWKGKRLFDATTCKNLGVKIDLNGNIPSDGEGFSGGKLHFEAWTQELFDDCQKKMAAKQDQGDSGEEFEEEEKDEVEKIRLIMKGRNMDEVKIVAKPTTPIEKLINAFRQRNNIPEGKEVSLWVDDDKLDPDSTVADWELEDMNMVEARIR